MAELPPDAPNESIQADCRKDLRSPLLALKVHVGDGQKFFFGYTKNISRSGMFVATLKQLEPGSRLTVAISLPAPISRQVQCECEVVWNRLFQKDSPLDPGVGMKFVDLPEDLADLIDTWVREQL